MWQDLVFSAGSIIFIIALVPAVVSHLKPPKSTSFPTSLVLTAYSFTLFSLDLYWSSALNLVTALMWFTIFIQRWRQEKNGSLNS